MDAGPDKKGPKRISKITSYALHIGKVVKVDGGALGGASRRKGHRIHSCDFDDRNAVECSEILSWERAIDCDPNSQRLWNLSEN